MENAEDFHDHEPSPLPFISRDPSRLFGQYEVNLFVSHEPDTVAPVLFEPEPDLQQRHRQDRTPLGDGRAGHRLSPHSFRRPCSTPMAAT